jgi:hypothetical protein
MFEEMKLPYHIVVEEQEYEEYCAVIDRKKVLILPNEYKENYDTFWKRDASNRCGSGAARNFCWDHSVKNGFARHWIFDDNIDRVIRFNHNRKIKCVVPTPLRIIEDFVLRYENVAIAGMGYAIFCPADESRPPMRLNTRIYSDLLIRNDIPYRWRGLYNEDTDLCLRALKDGWVTIEFNAFLIDKLSTQKIKGGNTDELYKDGTKSKSQMLVDMHPDVTKMIFQYGRWHHKVDYRRFKGNKLIRKQGIEIPTGINNYGMELYEEEK